jgi:hypothetical protein
VPGRPVSQVRDIPDSVSFRPVGRVRTALLGTWVRVSREVSKSSQIVSNSDNYAPRQQNLDNSNFTKL